MHKLTFGRGTSYGLRGGWLDECLRTTQSPKLSSCGTWGFRFGCGTGVKSNENQKLTQFAIGFCRFETGSQSRLCRGESSPQVNEFKNFIKETVEQVADELNIPMQVIDLEQNSDSHSGKYFYLWRWNNVHHPMVPAELRWDLIGKFSFVDACEHRAKIRAMAVFAEITTIKKPPDVRPKSSPLFPTFMHADRN